MALLRANTGTLAHFHQIWIAKITRLAQILIGSTLHTQLSFPDFIGGRIGRILNGSGVKFLSHDVKLVPYLLVIALLESVEFAIVCAPICVDLGVSVQLEDAPHRPLAVDKATVFNDQTLRSSTARTPKRTVVHLFFHLEYVIAAIYYIQLLVNWASRRILGLQLVLVSLFEFMHLHHSYSVRSMVLAHFRFDVVILVKLVVLTVDKPAETVVNFAIPGRGLLPGHFFDVFDGVKREIYVKRLDAAVGTRVDTVQTLNREGHGHLVSNLRVQIQRWNSLQGPFLFFMRHRCKVVILRSRH